MSITNRTVPMPVRPCALLHGRDILVASVTGAGKGDARVILVGRTLSSRAASRIRVGRACCRFERL